MTYDDYFQNKQSLNTFPTWRQIRDRMEWFVEKNREIARIETIGCTVEDRKIQAVLVTDPAHPIHDKEIVLIIMGRHGDELGTLQSALRLLGLAGF
jgi:hypothetical protein